jgi:hypothetical protein
MGGNQAIKQMKKACEAKGVSVFDTGVINWSHKQREEKINDMLGKMSKL